MSKSLAPVSDFGRLMELERQKSELGDLKPCKAKKQREIISTISLGVPPERCDYLKAADKMLRSRTELLIS